MKIKLIVALCLVALLQNSCTRALVCRVFNNTGHDIWIYSYDTKMNFQKYIVLIGGSKTIAFPTRLEIEADENRWRYDWSRVPMPPGYRHSKPFGPLEVSFQLEPTGFIYILHPATKSIVSRFEIQPDGFPLQPNTP